MATVKRTPRKPAPSVARSAETRRLDLAFSLAVPRDQREAAVRELMDRAR